MRKQQVHPDHGSFLFSYIFIFLNIWLYPTAYWTLIPQPGIEPLPPALEGGVFATGLPGKSPDDGSLYSGESLVTKSRKEQVHLLN